MKKLVSLHTEPLTKYTELDLNALNNLTYLHEFDRVVQ